jgi:hypothetical protein
MKPEDIRPGKIVVGAVTFEPAFKITREMLRNATPEQREEWAAILGWPVLEALEDMPEYPQGFLTVTAIDRTAGTLTSSPRARPPARR